MQTMSFRRRLAVADRGRGWYLSPLMYSTLEQVLFPGGASPSASQGYDTLSCLALSERARICASQVPKICTLRAVLASGRNAHDLFLEMPELLVLHSPEAVGWTVPLTYAQVATHLGAHEEDETKSFRTESLLPRPLCN